MDIAEASRGVLDDMRRDGARGFTLVELMIVVAIIGILSAIAIPNFLRFRLRAKTAEAKANLGAIKNLQIANYAENDYWITGQDWTPLHDLDKSVKIPWEDNTRFSVLGFGPEGDVYYEYRLLPTDVDISDTGYDCHARGDLDDNGLWSTYLLYQWDTELVHTGDQF